MLPLSVRRFVGGQYDRWQAARRQKKLLVSLRGDRVHCNICGWKGARFTDDPWHAGTICPVCRSQVRHRMLVAMLDGLASFPGLSETALLAGKDILHFAPERQRRGAKLYHRRLRARRLRSEIGYERHDIPDRRKL